MAAVNRQILIFPCDQINQVKQCLYIFSNPAEIIVLNVRIESVQKLYLKLEISNNGSILRKFFLNQNLVGQKSGIIKVPIPSRHKDIRS